MNDSIIVAYDGTAHADDAVALGVLLASCCEAPLALAHVYRTSLSTLPGAENSERERDRFLSRRGEELLAQGARLAGDGVDPERRVIGSTTTATGIRTLVERDGAGLVVFGSAAGTMSGRVHPGSATRRLAQVLPAPIAIAPAGFHTGRPDAVELLAVTADDNQGSARRSAEALAEVCGARLAADASQPGDLLFVGSGQDGEQGCLRLTSRGDRALQAATAPAVVVPYGRPLQLATLRAVAAA